MCKQTKQNIKLTKYDIDRAKKFADARWDEGQSLYEKRGGFKYEDILTGALGEIAAFKLLQDHGFKTNKPDFTIHEVQKKSYDADLMDDTRCFHVKAQTKDSERRYGTSWILQRTDPLLTKDQKSHYIIPCTVDVENKEVTIYCVANIETIKKNDLVGECKLPWFQKYKVALYWNDLRSLSYNARWGVLKR